MSEQPFVWRPDQSDNGGWTGFTLGSAFFLTGLAVLYAFGAPFLSSSSHQQDGGRIIVEETSPPAALPSSPPADQKQDKPFTRSPNGATASLVKNTPPEAADQRENLRGSQIDLRGAAPLPLDDPVDAGADDAAQQDLAPGRASSRGDADNRDSRRRGAEPEPTGSRTSGDVRFDGFRDYRALRENLIREALRGDP